MLTDDGARKLRIRGLRANASKLSHAELDEAEELDEGNPVEPRMDVRERRVSDMVGHRQPSSWDNEPEALG